MACRWPSCTLPRVLAALLFLGMVACLTNEASSKDASPPAPPDPTHACISAGDAQSRFAFADERVQVGDIATAYAVLQSLLTDCDPAVRDAALQLLGQRPGLKRNRLTGPASNHTAPPPGNPPATTCPDPSSWDQRFAIEKGFEIAGDFAAARVILAIALGDCDAHVRQVAQDRLTAVKDSKTTSCLGRPTWDQRFGYADILKAHGDVDAARAVLASALSDCDAAVRGDALTRLKDLPAAKPVCPDRPFWNERFAYAGKLKDWGDVASARALLVGALADCNAQVRTDAAKALIDLGPLPPSRPIPPPLPPQTASGADCPDRSAWNEWFAYEAKLRDAGDIAGARAMLAAAFSNCNATVRADALAGLTTLGPQPPSGPTGQNPPAPFCPDRSAWDQWFDYAAELHNWKDDVGAWALLTGGLSNCNPAVRADAKAELIALGNPADFIKGISQTPPPPAKCIHVDDWRARFDYAQKLIDAGDEAGARTVLVPALADCDGVLRNSARTTLEQTFERPSFWDRVLSASIDDRDIAIKAGVGLLCAVALYLIIIALRNIANRKRLGINPLTVTGEGFSGAQFVDIVSDTFFRADRLDGLQRDIAERFTRGTRFPHVTVGIARPRLKTPNVVDAISTVAEAISGDAGKLIAPMLKLVGQPCYACSGSLNISGGNAYLLIRLERRGRIIERWEKPDSTMNTLIGDLTDIALLILQTAAQDMDRPEHKGWGGWL